MRKPKVLLVPDSPNWAFDNRCNALIKHLSDWFFFEKVYWKEMPDIDYSIFDLAYYAGFYMVGSSRDKARDFFKKEQIVTSIPGLISWGAEQAIPFLNKAIAFSVLNIKLMKEFYVKTRSKCFFIPNGIDTELFKPIPRPENDVFTIGWVGNQEHKGKRLDELLSVVHNLNGVKLLVQRKDHFIPYSEMPKFYNQLDTYCCVSISEGSNNPLSEAMACGLPIISTSVGIANEIMPSGTGFFVRQDLGDLSEKIIAMRDLAPEQRKMMGEIARQRMLASWRWAYMAGRYKDMFEYALSKQ